MIENFGFYSDFYIRSSNHRDPLCIMRQIIHDATIDKSLLVSISLVSRLREEKTRLSPRARIIPKVFIAADREKAKKRSERADKPPERESRRGRGGSGCAVREGVRTEFGGISGGFVDFNQPPI